MINRQFADSGIHPALGYIFILTGFVGGSLILFAKTEIAEYVLIMLALSLVIRLSDSHRNHFLMTCFRDKEFYLIRLLENAIIILPFIIIMVYKLLFILALMLIVLASLFALISLGNNGTYTIPTPFYKKPFEFTAGFRGAFFMFIIAYFLAIMSLTADNFNLGIFSMLLVYLVSISFYFNPESVFYVWIYNLTPPKFLWNKINTALLFSLALSLPVTLALIIFFPDEFLLIIGLQALSSIYLATVILAKYSSFPDQINLPQFIILALSVWFPPLLVAVIPFFYWKSVNRLKEIL
jgi:hypothetical protein